jgi:hypothetical protein
MRARQGVGREENKKKDRPEMECSKNFSLLKSFCILKTVGVGFLRRKVVFVSLLLEFYFKIENGE